MISLLCYPAFYQSDGETLVGTSCMGLFVSLLQFFNKEGELLIAQYMASEVIRKLITCQNKHVSLEMTVLKIIYISFSGLNNFKGILKFLPIIQFTLVLTYSHIEGPA